MAKLKVGVISGGWGEEREVSLQTGQFVIKNLDREKYEVVEVVVNDIKDILVLKNQVDVVFIALHGKWGEGGHVQAILDILKLPYTSASPLASYIGMNKWLFKKALATEGIKVSDDIILDYINQRMVIGRGGNYKKILNRVCLRQTSRLIKELWSYPIFVKPVDSGSSFGITKVSKEKELRAAVKTARQFSQQILIEPTIKGKELTVSFVGKTVLPTILIIPQKGKFFDYPSKYETGGAKEICPAPIDSKLNNRLKRLTRTIKQIVGVETYGRVDFIYNETEDQLYPLEINTIPGMTATSLLPKAARTFGWSNSQLLDEILQLALVKKV